MTTQAQGLDMEALEAMVDRHGLDGVIDMLSTICGEKAEHVASNWQDAALTKQWERRGNALDKCASRLLDI